MTSAATIAEQLRTAGSNRGELMATLYADQVDLRHVPPLATDGPIPGRLLAEVSLREVAAVEKALADRTEASEIAVEGEDGIRLIGRTTGTMADGTEVDVTTRVLLTVAAGRVVGLEADLDELSMASWGKVLLAGGFEVPDDLSARRS